MDAADFLERPVTGAQTQMDAGVAQGGPSWASPRLVALDLGWDEEQMRRGLAQTGLCWAEVEQAARGHVAVSQLVARVPARGREVELRPRSWRLRPAAAPVARLEPCPAAEAPAVPAAPPVAPVEAPAPPPPSPAGAAHWSDAGVYVALDVETTGNTDQDRVIELALVFFKDFAPVSSFVRRYSNQGRALDSWAVKTHGITAADLRGCPPIEEDLARVHGWLSRAPAVVAHNMPYDKRMLGYELLRVGLEWPSGPRAIDTLPLSKRANPTKKKGYTLQDVCWLYQVKLDKHHSALSDARAAGEVWAALHKRGVRV